MQNAKVLLGKLAVSEKNSKGKKELDKLEIGQRVLIQCPQSKLWRESGMITSLDNEYEQLYWIKRDG